MSGEGKSRKVADVIRQAQATVEGLNPFIDLGFTEDGKRITGVRPLGDEAMKVYIDFDPRLM
jgi:hypothetical protein